MANTAQARKRARQSEKRRLGNMRIRSRVMTTIKKARKALNTGSANEAVTAVKQASQHIDSMTTKGIFHKNKAARLKSRLNANLKQKNQSK